MVESSEEPDSSDLENSVGLIDRITPIIKASGISVIQGVGTVVFAYILTIFVLYLFGQQFSLDPSGTIPQVLLHVLEFATLGLFALFFSYIIGSYDYIDARIPTRKHLVTSIGVIFLMLTFQVFFNGLIQLLGAESAENTVVNSGLGDPIFYLYMVPVMIFFVGPVEEYVFRGIIQDTFTEKVNFKTGLLVASLLFGMIHITSIEGASLEALLYIASSSVLGLVLGYYYHKTRNIIVPMLAHGIYNSILMLTLYFVSVI